MTNFGTLGFMEPTLPEDQRAELAAVAVIESTIAEMGALVATMSERDNVTPAALIDSLRRVRGYIDTLIENLTNLAKLNESETNDD